MAFREKSAWAALLSVLAVYGFYFSVLANRLAASPAPSFRGLWVVCAFVFIVIQIVLQSAVAIAARGEANAPRDERERLIGLRSDRLALAVLSGLGCCGALWMMLRAEPGEVILANALLLGLVLSEVAKYASQVVAYRWRV